MADQTTDAPSPPDAPYWSNPEGTDPPRSSMARINQEGIDPARDLHDDHVNHTTGAEIGFLEQIPQLIKERLGRGDPGRDVLAWEWRNGERQVTDQMLVKHYTNYLNAMTYRKDWQEMDPVVIKTHCKRLLRRYTDREKKRYARELKERDRS